MLIVWMVASAVAAPCGLDVAQAGVDGPVTLTGLDCARRSRCGLQITQRKVGAPKEGWRSAVRARLWVDGRPRATWKDDLEAFRATVDDLVARDACWFDTSTEPLTCSLWVGELGTAFGVAAPGLVVARAAPTWAMGFGERGAVRALIALREAGVCAEVAAIPGFCSLEAVDALGYADDPEGRPLELGFDLGPMKPPMSLAYDPLGPGKGSPPAEQTHPGWGILMASAVSAFKAAVDALGDAGGAPEPVDKDPDKPDMTLPSGVWKLGGAALRNTHWSFDTGAVAGFVGELADAGLCVWPSPEPCTLLPPQGELGWRVLVDGVPMLLSREEPAARGVLASLERAGVCAPTAPTAPASP